MSADTSQSQGPQAPPGEDPGDLPPSDAFKAATRRIGELLEYVRQYVSAQADLARAQVRRIVVLAVLGAVALLAFATIIATLVVMFCRGLSDLLAQALGGRAWAGDLIVSIGFISLIVLGAWLGLGAVHRKQLKNTVNRYEQRRLQQRARYGHDAAQRARQGRNGLH